MRTRIPPSCALLFIGSLACSGQVGSPDPTGGGSGPGSGPGTGPGPGTGTGPNDIPPPPVFEAVSPLAYTAKVKNLLTGLPPTSAELSAVMANPSALRGFIDQWTALPEFEKKMTAFFRNAFQQAQVDNSLVADQLGGRNIPGNGVHVQRLLVNMMDSFPRTAWDLVATGSPFNGALNTRQIMVTPALATLLAFMDDRYVDDAGRSSSQMVKANPMFSISVENSLTPITPEESLDPASPNYMKWYSSIPMPNCTVPVRTFTGQDAAIQLMSVLLGRVDTDKTITDNVTCRAYNPAPVMGDADFTTWRSVTIREPKPGEATTKFFDLATLRTGKELVLRVPRIGFFGQPAFLANWSTNSSNEYRVTMNQTMIVALGSSFDDSNNTVPVSETAVDKDHADPTSACYGCHQTLDPMRQLFRQSYTLFYHEQLNPVMIADKGVFAFGGVTQVANGVPEMATMLAEHPRFAVAWTQKLCFYADSAACSEDDPEFLRVADVFQKSGFNWKTLVGELFSSPLVTGASHTKTFDDREVVVSVARVDHLCVALSNRLGLPDVCGVSGLPGLTPAQNSAGVLARTMPSDGYSRGNASPVFSTDSSLFFRAGTENLCRRIADQVVDARPPAPSRYASKDPATAITDFVQTVMALPDSDPRAASARGILDEHFQAAMKTPATPAIRAIDALKSTFVLACTSPSVVAVGL